MYTVLNDRRDIIDKKLTALQKKAAKYDKIVDWHYSEPYMKSYKLESESGERISVTYEVVDLTIDSDGIIKKDGYSILAKIEHMADSEGERVNVVTNLDSTENRLEWLTVEPHCDHCGRSQVKKVTYIVSNGTEEKQIGRTCLKEYCGIDPQMAALSEQISTFVEDEENPETFMSSGCGMCDDFMTTYGLAIGIIKEQGYVKSDTVGSNKDVLLRKLTNQDRPTEAQLDEAEKASEFLSGLTDEKAFDMGLDKVWAMAKTGYCKYSHAGYIAYAPIAVKKAMERIEAEARRKEADAASKYMGTVGESIRIAVRESKLLTSWPNGYGTTYLYRIVDENGNVYIWKASKRQSEDLSSKYIAATVKDHSERDGVKQTIIMRCKVVA